MTAEFGKPQRPAEQWALSAPAGKKSQERWIVGCFADEEFTLTVALDDDDCTEIETPPRPYSELWSTLAELDLRRRKYWLIGHRTRYAMDQAEFLTALNEGRVGLPRSKKKGESSKRSGKLAYSLGTLEVDLVCGKNRIKLLDWKNYGFNPEQGIRYADPAATHAAADQLYAFQKAMNEAGVSITKTTSAQLGWQHARQHHAPPVMLYNLDERVRAMERRAYFGGRNEAYRLGDLPDAVLSMDVKSCYAHVCQTCEVPIYQVADYPLGLKVEDMKAAPGHQWIADVIVSTPEPDYPVRHHGIPIYPTGTFCTSLAWPELLHAMQRGRIEKVLRAGYYRCALAMQPYAAWYMNARQAVQQSDTPEQAIAIKAMFNASLGFTARQKYTLVPWEMDIDRNYWIGYTSAPDHSAPIVHAQVLDGVKEWLKVGGEPREALPFLHATICSHARIRLLEIFYFAGREWIHYCDTDGILVDYRGYANLLDTPGMIGKNPGQLSERFKSGPCRIQGQKNYRIGDSVICAGLARERHSQYQDKKILETPTGRVDPEGRVTPFEMRCEDSGGVEAKYVNVIA